MTITSKIYSILTQELANYTDLDAYASDLSLSSIWGDDLEAEIPAERFEALREFYRVANLSTQEIRKEAGMTQAALSARFCIQKRTVEKWCASKDTGSYRECPDYVRLMMLECLGMLPFEVKAKVE